MGSSMSGGEGFDEEPMNDKDFGGGESDDKPFDDEPFDAGVEADEDESPEKYIQQLSGKLGQSLRSYTDDLAEPDFDLEKFAINSVLSATNTSKMDAEDQSDIIQKVKSASTDTIGSEDNGEEDVDNGEEPTDNGEEDEGLDLADIDMEVEESHNPNHNKKTVFSNSTLGVKNGGMEENKYLTLESEDNSSKLKQRIQNMIKETFMTVDYAPEIEPMVKPQVKPAPKRETRRAKPFTIKPSKLPNPNPKAKN